MPWQATYGLAHKRTGNTHHMAGYGIAKKPAYHGVLKSLYRDLKNLLTVH